MRGGGIDKCLWGVNMHEAQIYIKQHSKAEMSWVGGGVVSLNWAVGVVFTLPTGGGG